MNCARAPTIQSDSTRWPWSVCEKQFDFSICVHASKVMSPRFTALHTCDCFIATQLEIPSTTVGYEASGSIREPVLKRSCYGGTFPNSLNVVLTNFHFLCQSFCCVVDSFRLAYW
jgi:hypothetical protein